METKRLILRRWETGDAEDLYQYASDPEVGPIAGWPPHQSVDESRDVIQNVFNGKEAYAICLKEDRRAIGAIELKLNGHTDMTDRDDECEMGYWLGKPFWGQGIMPGAVKEMLRHAFEDCGMQKVWIGYYEGNAKSKRVQEKCGFRYQWRSENVDVPLMHEKRTGHVSLMTKEDWELLCRGSDIDITELGNPAKPQGTYGKVMLQDMNAHHASVTEWGLHFLKIPKDAVLLDIGCGGGATLKKLAERAPEGKVYGLDYSDVSVRESTAFNQELVDEGKIEIRTGSVESMPFPDCVFDGITTVESFYFWPDPEQNLKEVRRVLKETGIFLLIADIYGGYEFDEHTKENIEKYHLFNPAPEEFEQLFRNAGFSGVAVHLKEGTSWICVEGHK